MSAVTLGDQGRALALLGTGSARRDEMLLSLARQRSWTEAQRKLVEQLWAEQARRQGEHR